MRESSIACPFIAGCRKRRWRAVRRQAAGERRSAGELVLDRRSASSHPARIMRERITRARLRASHFRGAEFVCVVFHQAVLGASPAPGVAGDRVLSRCRATEPAPRFPPMRVTPPGAKVAPRALMRANLAEHGSVVNCCAWQKRITLDELGKMLSHVVKSIGDLATKDDLKEFATKTDLAATEKRLGDRFDGLNVKSTV